MAIVLGIEAAHALEEKRTGVGEYALQIILALKKVIPSEVRVVLYVHKTPSSDLFGELPAHWEVRVLYWPFKKLWSQLRLSWEIMRRPPTVFFAPAQLLPWATPRKVVVTIHDSAFMSFPSAYRFLSRTYLRAMNLIIMKRATRIVTTSNFNREEIKRWYGELAQNKTVVIPLAYDARRWHERTPQEALAVQARYGLQDSSYIVALGRLEEKKNTWRVVAAYTKLRREQPALSTGNFRLVLIGIPGAGYEKVAQAIAGSLYKNEILQLGYVSEEDTSVLVQGAKFLVFASKYEGFGMPILEAFAMGTPVIASLGTAMPEVGGEAAYYVDPNNIEGIAKVMAQLLQNPEQRLVMRQKGLVRAVQFSWENTAKATWEAIAKLVKV